jgi:hypothetical protein
VALDRPQPLRELARPRRARKRGRSGRRRRRARRWRRARRRRRRQALEEKQLHHSQRRASSLRRIMGMLMRPESGEGGAGEGEIETSPQIASPRRRLASRLHSHCPSTRHQAWRAARETNAVADADAETHKSLAWCLVVSWLVGGLVGGCCMCDVCLCASVRNKGGEGEERESDEFAAFGRQKEEKEKESGDHARNERRHRNDAERKAAPRRLFIASTLRPFFLLLTKQNKRPHLGNSHTHDSRYT